MSEQQTPNQAIKNIQIHQDRVLVQEYVSAIEMLIEMLGSVSRNLVPVIIKQVEELRTTAPDRMIFASYYLAADDQVKILPQASLMAIRKINIAYKQMYDYSK